MDLNKFSTGNYLKSDDVKTISGLWSVLSGEARDFPDGQKAVLVLETTTPKDGYVKKEFCLNMTNINRLIECFGTVITEEMTGKQLKLKVERVDYKGNRVDGIRIDVEQTIAINKDR